MKINKHKLSAEQRFLINLKLHMKSYMKNIRSKNMKRVFAEKRYEMLKNMK